MSLQQAELQEDMEARGERMGGVQTHKRMIASLEKQIAVQEKKLEQVSRLTRFNWITIQIISFSLNLHSCNLKLCLSLPNFLSFSQVQEKHNKLQETLSEAEEQLSQVIIKCHIFQENIPDLFLQMGQPPLTNLNIILSLLTGHLSKWLLLIINCKIRSQAYT